MTMWSPPPTPKRTLSAIMECIETENTMKETLEQLKGHHYEFENLAFEGGGAKMGSYVGVIKTLEELGILPQCKRFAGTSGGAIIASLLAINLNAAQVKKLMQLKMRSLLIDSTFGAISMVPNVMKRFGWNPANKFLNILKQIMEEHTGNPNITFREVYKKYNKILCVVATNVSTMSVEYFHPKTTPDFPVALAVRSSMALPGYLQPVRHETEAGLAQYYVDGGLVCNFPLHCFDGWYLSMETENSFFNKLGGTEAPFDVFNSKTLGFLLYTAWEGEFMQGNLHSRQKDQVIKRPSTSLAKSRQKRCDEILKENEKRHQMVEAGKRFLQTLREVDVDRDCEITLKEFKEAFDKLTIRTEDKELLFGENFDFEQAFRDIDKDTNGKITFDEFLWYMQKKGIRFRALLEGGNMMNINTFGEFFEVTFNTVLNMTRKVYFKEHDNDRTVGIYTDYIDTTDFHLEEQDKDFIVRQGVIATLAYFRELLDKWSNKKLPPVMHGCIRPKVVSENDITVMGLTDRLQQDLKDKIRKKKVVESGEDEEVVEEENVGNSAC